MGRTDVIYKRLPVPLQHAAITTYGLYWWWVRFGPGYREALRAFRERERLDADGWRSWQKDSVRRVTGMASDSVPFYRERWSAEEKAAARAGRLEQLPLLEKDVVRSDPEAFVRVDRRSLRPLRFYTSGSTGTPVTSIWKTREFRASRALRESRSANWAGVSFTQPRATFSGRNVVPDAGATTSFYRFNAVEKQVYLSAFHLRTESARGYIDALRKHDVVWATGYAVSFYLLARMVLESGLDPHPLKAVVTTSEKVTPEMRRTMEQAFGCKVYEEYSTVENAMFASECPEGRLHVSPDVGVVEILRDDGTPCEPGEPGEVVATSLMRTYQPLIRYRLGDVASWSEEPCVCGRSMPVLEEVVGRIEDVVTGPDGRKMVRFHGVFIDQPHVREGQIVQEAVDRVLVKVVPTNGFASDDEADLIARVRQRLGPDVTVTVERVDEIPRTKSGKYKAVVSLVPDEER